MKVLNPIETNEDIKEDIKEDVKEDVKENIKEDVKENIKEDVKEDVKENIKEDVKENIKEDVKENIKEDVKENIKEDVKEDVKENIKEDVKENIKEDVKENIKEDVKEINSNKKVDYSYYRKFIRLIKPICRQTVIMIIVLLLYINLYSGDIYDFIIYFCFGLHIAVMCIATFMLITKYNLISNKNHIIKLNQHKYLLNFCNKFLDLSDETTVKCGACYTITYHIIFPIIAFIYVRKYIKRAKKTNNAFLISFILFCIWGIINIYFVDIIKYYNKGLKTTDTERTTAMISITITYSGLLYYFETIKNEKANLLS
jgi:flagellin-like hook-associated protein FlgL